MLRTWKYFEWIIKQSLNLAFKWYEKLFHLWRTESSLCFFSWSVIWATIFLVRRDFSQVFIYSWFPIPRQFLCERISGFDTWFCYMVEPPYNEPLYRAIFVWPLKMVSVRVRYLFYLLMDEKIKTWTKTEKSKDYCKADSEQLVVFS